MSAEEIDDIINDLNNHIYDILGENASYYFEYSSNGYCTVIKFSDEVLWNSEDEGRKWIEEVADYESLLEYIKKQFNQYIKDLNKLKFKKI